MEERAAEENEVVEKAERMGSVAMELSAHLADLTYLALISLAQHRSLFSLSFFFLSSSTPHRSCLSFFFLLLISPKFFFCGCGLIFLAWVVVGFIFVVVGWL